MVTSHPWLVSAIGDLEQKNLRISPNSYRMKQVYWISTISASEPGHQQLWHLWSPMIICLSHYLIVRVPIYVYLRPTCELCCHVSIRLCLEKSIQYPSQFFFFFFVIIMKNHWKYWKLFWNTEIRVCIFNQFYCIKLFLWVNLLYYRFLIYLLKYSVYCFTPLFWTAVPYQAV